MKNIKYVLILVLAFLSFICVGCNKKDPDEDKEVFDVVEVKESYEQAYEYDEFELSFLKIRLIYSDGTSKDIPVTEDMVDEKDLAKLNKAGNPRILITYSEDFQFTYILNLIDSSELDQDLNKNGAYNAVIKAIKKKKKGCINFILEPKDSVCALAFSYVFDKDKMQVSGGTINESLDGIGTIKLDNDKITFAYTAKDAMTSEVILFSVNYTGDFRNSSLRVNEEYNNVVYTLNQETGYTEALVNILYHASVK